MRILPPALVLLVGFIGNPIFAQQEPEVITFEDRNQTLKISPPMGRITHFSRRGGPNLLRVNPKPDTSDPKRTWPNYGGDWIWTAQQATWPSILGRAWPPDEVTDGGKWSVLLNNGREITIQSPMSPYQKVQVGRHISTGFEGVSFYNSVTQVEPTDHVAQVWSITQIIHPEYVLLHVIPKEGQTKLFTELNAERPSDEFVKPVDGTNNTVIRYQPSYDASRKIGTRGRWMAAVFKNDVLIQKTEYDPEGNYPDNASLEVYADSAYVEIEVLSPAKKLGEGIASSTGIRVSWYLWPREDDATLVKNLTQLFSSQP